MTSASLISGAATRHFGRTRSWMGGGLTIFGIAASLLIGLSPHSIMQSWLPFTMGSAFGAGISLQLPFVIVTSELEDEDRITDSM